MGYERIDSNINHASATNYFAPRTANTCPAPQPNPNTTRTAPSTSPSPTPRTQPRSTRARAHSRRRAGTASPRACRAMPVHPACLCPCQRGRRMAACRATKSRGARPHSTLPSSGAACSSKARGRQGARRCGEAAE